MEILKKALQRLLINKKIRTSPMRMNMKEFRKELKDIKLEVLLFCHFMYEEDDKLSIPEKRFIINLINEECESIPESLEVLFKQWMEDPPSFGYILDFAKENKYTYDDLDEAIREFVHHTDSNSKYHNVIRDVRKKLLLEKEYLS